MNRDMLYEGVFVCCTKGNIFRFGYVLPEDYKTPVGYYKLAVRKLVDGIILSDDWEVISTHGRTIDPAHWHMHSLAEQESVFPTMAGQSLLNYEIRQNLQNMGVQYKNGCIVEGELLRLLVTLKKQATVRTTNQASV